MLLGNPLALVQAELDLTLLGLPLIDMSLARAARRTSAPRTRSPAPTAASTRVRFGVRLGQPARGPTTG